MRGRLSRALDNAWYGGGWLSIVLLPVSWLYRVLLAVTRKRGSSRDVRLPVPVVVVGNITVGGTGKTPLVIWLVRQLCRAGFRPAVVTRGYLGAASERVGGTEPALVTADSSAVEFGDEAVLLAQRLPDCPVVAGRDRIAAIRHVADTSNANVVVCDDGLQHFALHPDCSIVVVDGRRGLGNTRLLPAGPLRESVDLLRRADLVLVNGGQWEWPGAVRFGLRSSAVTQLSDGERRTLGDFAGCSVHAMAAIGNPERFFAMLRDADCIADTHAWPDHAVIPAAAMQFDDGAPVLITWKDAVKCALPAPAGIWAVDIDVDMPTAAEAEVMRVIVARIESAAASS